MEGMTSSSRTNSSFNCGETAKTYHLYPAELFVHRSPHLITTILGSCVSVCIYDNVLKFGGMNHYMLPLWNGNGLASPKYGNIAIPKLIEKMEALGANRNCLIAKIFGGGEVIERMSNHFNIGERNILIAKKMLEEYNIPIVGSSVGGPNGRKIEMCTFSSEVRMKLVKKQQF